MGKFLNNEKYISNSCHSYNRAKERAGLNRKRAEKMIQLARVRGIGYEDCSWSLDKMFLQKRTDEKTKAVAYNGYCFIFNKNTLKCVTMFPLPRRFGKKKSFYYTDTGRKAEVYEHEYA
jgi:hypothetical protein